MKLETELKRAFGKNSVSWESIDKSASAIGWVDWVERGPDSQSLIRVFEKKANDLKDLANRFSWNLDVVVRNAVAVGYEDRLEIISLVLIKMLHDGDLEGKPSDWLAKFPKPSSLEKFLASYIRGNFQPTQALFSELLKTAQKTNAESISIENLVHSTKKHPETSSELFSVLLRHGITKVIDAERMIATLDGLAKAAGIKPDLTLDGLKKFPKAWRIQLLSNAKRSKYYFSKRLCDQLSKNPFLLKETKSSIADENLLGELRSGLRENIIDLGTLDKFIQSDGFLRRLGGSVDWKFVSRLNSVSSEGSRSKKIYDSFDAAQKSLPSQSAANVALLYLVWSSHSNLPNLLYKTTRSLKKFVRAASMEVLKFSIRCSSGQVQRDLYEFVKTSDIPKISSATLSELPLSGQLDGNTNITMVIDALVSAGDKTLKKAYSTAFSDPDLGLRLLESSEAFQSRYLRQTKQEKIPKYSISDEAFKVYGKIGSAGLIIIETLLSRVDKIEPSVSVPAILQKTILHAPELIPEIFQKRGVAPLQFVKIISNPAFARLSVPAQIGIFALSTRGGKSAFRQASKQNQISEELFAKLEKIASIRTFLVNFSATKLTIKKATLPELLSSLVFTPTLGREISLQFTPAQLKRALPKAMERLEGKTRISAALELAVLSDLNALPVFLQLVKMIAPPYKTKELGRRLDDLYTTYELPKKSGGSRTISAPAPHLKQAQRALLQLLYKEKFSSAAVGFMPGKSIKDNASQHVGRAIVVNSDIKGFFPSTSYKQVYALSRRLVGEGLSPLAARLFSEICCHDGHLATGAPTSPAVSNLILKPLDEILLKISKKLKVSYSRYADDLTFSGDSAAVWMLKPVEAHLSKLGYELDPKKTNIFRRGRRQTVTGAVVNEKVSLARPLRKQLRAAVHRRANGGQPEMHGEPLSDQALKGYLAYLSMLSTEHAKPLLKKLEALEDWKL